MSQDKVKILPSEVYKWTIIENKVNHNVKFLIKKVRIKVKKNSHCNIPYRQGSLICTFLWRATENINQASIIYHLLRL